MNERRLRAALQGFVTKVRDERIYGTLGRVNADSTVTIVVAERADHVYVRMNSDVLITLPNIGKGRVPLRAGLPVQMMRLSTGDLLLDGQDDRLLEGDENAPNMEADLAYHAYLIDALTTQLAAVDFLVLTDTPADYVGASGKTVAVNAAGNALEFVDLPVPAAPVSYEPLTNGDSVNPELIFADGDVIMVEMTA